MNLVKSACAVRHERGSNTTALKNKKRSNPIHGQIEEGSRSGRPRTPASSSPREKGRQASRVGEGCLAASVACGCGLGSLRLCSRWERAFQPGLWWRKQTARADSRAVSSRRAVRRGFGIGRNSKVGASTDALSRPRAPTTQGRTSAAQPGAGHGCEAAVRGASVCGFRSTAAFASLGTRPSNPQTYPQYGQTPAKRRSSASQCWSYTGQMRSNTRHTLVKLHS